MRKLYRGKAHGYLTKDKKACIKITITGENLNKLEESYLREAIGKDLFRAADNGLMKLKNTIEE